MKIFSCTTQAPTDLRASGVHSIAERIGKERGTREQGRRWGEASKKRDAGAAEPGAGYEDGAKFLFAVTGLDERQGGLRTPSRVMVYRTRHGDDERSGSIVRLGRPDPHRRRRAGAYSRPAVHPSSRLTQNLLFGVRNVVSRCRVGADQSTILPPSLVYATPSAEDK